MICIVIIIIIIIIIIIYQYLLIGLYIRSWADEHHRKCMGVYAIMSEALEKYMKITVLRNDRDIGRDDMTILVDFPKTSDIIATA